MRRATGQEARPTQGDCMQRAPTTHKSTRRTLLRGVAATAAVPLFVPATALGRAGRAAPADRITVGFIGCGKMCNDYHIPELLGQSDTQALAVCDVDETRREHARKRIEDHYGQESKQGYRGCAEYVDFRELIARRDIDT